VRLGGLDCLKLTGQPELLRPRLRYLRGELATLGLLSQCLVGVDLRPNLGLRFKCEADNRIRSAGLSSP
jgi:hypothetical protein